MSDQDIEQQGTETSDTQEPTSEPKLSGSWGAALFGAALLIPVLMSTTAIVIYVSPWRLANWATVLVGFGVAAALWLLLAGAYRPFTAVVRANSSSYGDLRESIAELEARLNAACPPGQSGSKACLEARAHLDDVSRELRCRDTRWIFGTGYINAWRSVHLAEEALIDVEEPDAAIIGQAVYDGLRIKGSTIDDGGDLLWQLKLGVASIAPQAVQYVDAHAPGVPAVPAPPDPTSGRAVLRTVRHSLNEFRDDRWDGIVRARNQLGATVAVTWLIVSLLVVVAILAGVARENIISVSAFFLVGAAVGLFNRLALESGTDTAINDYGLTVARLANAPLFSGLAGVGGVVLTALLPIIQGAQTGTSAPAMISLSDIFRLTKHPASLVIAGVFGVSPTLLITRLSSAADQYRKDLTSTTAPDRGRH